MSEERARIRLFVDQALAPGVAVGLGAEQAHYLRSVMRLSAGAPLLLFNGRDGEWRARLDGLGKGWASCAVESRTRIQDRGPDLWLVFAPIKRARIDFVAEKATELGVSGLWPVFTRWTAVGRVNVERLRANAIEAAEQCGRLSVPEIFRRQRSTKCWRAGRRNGASSCATRPGRRRRSPPPWRGAMPLSDPGR